MDALFEEVDRRTIRAHPGVVSPHAPGTVTGGALAAAALVLAGPPRSDFRLGRLTASFHAVAALDVPINWSLHPGPTSRRVQHHQVLMHQQGRLVLTVDTLWLRTTPGSLKAASSWPPPPPSPGSPDAAPIPAWNDGFFGGALEVIAGGFDGVGAGTARLRLRTEVVRGRGEHHTAAVVAAVDVMHAVAAPVTTWPPPVAFINPDVTVVLAREPAGPGVDISAHAVWPGDGTGLSVATFADAAGVLGHVTQCQVLTPVPQPVPDQPRR